MKKTLIMKAAVLGTIACCSFSGPGIAANIQDTNEIGVGRTAVDEAKREAVHSTWMDRTDVVIGIGPKSTEETAGHRWHNFTYDRPSTVTSDKSKSTELNKLYIETLQPPLIMMKIPRALPLCRGVSVVAVKKYLPVN